MNLKEKFRQLDQEQTALLAANFYNFETAQGIVKAAAEMKMPVILQASPSSIQYMGAGVAVSIGRSVLDYYGVEGWLHLDHAHSPDLIKECLEAGFDSVMIDASERSFEENIAVSKKIARMASAYGASVEAELGYVAKLGQSQQELGFTEPAEAKKFVDQTGVHALAVAIGSAHGFYKREPNLDLERLSEIDNVIDIALVLHGASGIPAEQLQEGIRRGIRKINMATEFKDQFMSALKQKLSHSDEIDLRKVFPSATSKLTELVKQKLEIIRDA